MSRDVLYAIETVLRRARILHFPNFAVVAAEIVLREIRNIIDGEIASHEKNHPYAKGLRYARDLFDPDALPPKGRKKADD